MRLAQKERRLKFLIIPVLLLLLFLVFVNFLSEFRPQSEFKAACQISELVSFIKKENKTKNMMDFRVTDSGFMKSANEKILGVCGVALRVENGKVFTAAGNEVFFLRKPKSLTVCTDINAPSFFNFRGRNWWVSVLDESGRWSGDGACDPI